MPHPSVKLPVVVWPSRLQQLEAMFTTGYAVLAILLTMSAMYFLFAERSADLGPGTPQTARTNPLYLLVWMALHVATALLLVKSVLDRGVQPSLLSVCPMLLLVIGSLTWSVAANATLYFGLLLTLTIRAWRDTDSSRTFL